jgi:hypothetical protein
LNRNVGHKMQDVPQIQGQCKVTVIFKESSESFVTHTLTRFKSSFSKTTSHFSSVSSGILLLGFDRISSNFFILLSFSTSVSNNILLLLLLLLLLLHSAFLQLSMLFSIGFFEFQQIYKYCVIYTYSFIHSMISVQPLGQFGRNQSSVRRLVWLWHTASWASS